MDPADAEADAGRAEAVGERDHGRLADARDHDAVQLDAVDELLEERLVGRRLGDRLRQVALELLAALDAEDGALAARVDGLEHRREGDRGERGVDVGLGAKAAYGGCGSPARRARRASRACASGGGRSAAPMPGRPSSSATAATTGTARSAETVSTPSHAARRAASTTAWTSAKSTTSATSAAARPGASAFRSTAATRSPRARACSIARR